MNDSKPNYRILWNGADMFIVCWYYKCKKREDVAMHVAITYAPYLNEFGEVCDFENKVMFTAKYPNKKPCFCMNPQGYHTCKTCGGTNDLDRMKGLAV